MLEIQNTFFFKIKLMLSAGHQEILGRYASETDFFHLFNWNFPLLCFISKSMTNNRGSAK